MSPYNAIAIMSKNPHIVMRVNGRGFYKISGGCMCMWMETYKEWARLEAFHIDMVRPDGRPMAWTISHQRPEA